MKPADTKKNRRVLIVDDNEDIHKDFYRILNPGADTADLDRMEASFFGSKPAASQPLAFELTSAYQGAEALTAVRRALEDSAPFALAFVDMRMPPGWDGIETLQRLWEADPALQAVICSAHADYSWDDIITRFGQTDRLLILKKPCDPIEIRQMASALTEKWSQKQEAAEAARRVAVQYAVTQILMEAGTPAEASAKLVRTVGEVFGWPAGALWLATEGDLELRPAASWSRASGELEELTAASPRGISAAGDGALARAFASGEPSWTACADEASDPGGARAARAGLRSRLLLPIRHGDLTAGVLEFFDPKGHPPDQGLFDTLREICSKIGQFMERDRVVSALRKSEANNRALLHALPDTILRVDANGTCLDYKPGAGRGPSPAPRFSVGSSIGGALPEGVAQQLLHRIEGALSAGTSELLEYEQPAGEEVLAFEARIAGISSTEAVVVIRDLTESRRAKVEAAEKRVWEETSRAQAETLLALSTPLIPITDDIVVMPLIGILDASRMQQVQAALVQGIAARRTRVAILDITGVTSLSSQIADEIMRAAQAVRLLGANVILTGIQPEIARTLVDLGRDLSSITIHRTLQSGIATAIRTQ